MAGVFIAFEGVDGAGKSTQARLLHSRLVAEGHDAILIREPGSTELGDYLRAYLVDQRPLSPLAELLLFEAARVELMTALIAPKLDAHAVVIADRFAASTVAYQGYGRAIDLERIAWLNDFATGGRYPDLTIFLDIDPQTGFDRVQTRQLELGDQPGDTANRFEDEALQFRQAVRAGFIEQAERNPEKWLRIDGSRATDDIAAEIHKAVAGLVA